MNENSVKKIKGQIKSAFTDTKLNDGLWGLGSNVKPFENIAIELNKRKSPFKIDASTCKKIYLHASSAYKKAHGFDSSIVLSEFTESEVDAFCNYIFTHYKDTPFTYKIVIPFQWMKPLPDFSTGDYINVKVGRRQLTRFKEGVFESHSELVINSHGAFSLANKKTFLKESLLPLNVVIFLLKQNGVLRSGEFDGHFISIVDLLTGKNEAFLEVQAKIICEKYAHLNEVLSLPVWVSKYINELSLTLKFDGFDEIKKLAMNDVIFSIANSLMENKSNEALRIKSAIDWFVQAEINEDDTMSFIQVCMGLESIFGDNDSEGGLTNTLADRCAYLIGRNIAERKKIKEEFKDMYKVRSKIVHGVKSHLSQNESHIKNSAFYYLQRAIFKEIRNLRDLPENIL